jgi:hypothetical protein
MADKKVLLQEDYANLSIEELEGVAGGFHLSDLTPEEKKEWRRLREEFDRARNSGSPASEEFKRYIDYSDMLSKKYDPDFNNGKN